MLTDKNLYTCTYIIECEDGSLFTGIAKDVVQRLRQHFHHLPGCAKYTLSHQMKAIRAVWETEDKVAACRLEYWIKRLTKKQKLMMKHLLVIVVCFSTQIEIILMTTLSKDPLSKENALSLHQQKQRRALLTNKKYNYGILL